MTADQPLGINGHFDVMSGRTVLATSTWPAAVTGRSIVLEGQGVADDVVARTL